MNKNVFWVRIFIKTINTGSLIAERFWLTKHINFTSFGGNFYHQKFIISLTLKLQQQGKERFKNLLQRK